MKITEKLPDGSYITYENMSEYMSGCFYKQIGCSECLIFLLIIIVKAVKNISYLLAK